MGRGGEQTCSKQARCMQKARSQVYRQVKARIWKRECSKKMKFKVHSWTKRGSKLRNRVTQTAIFLITAVFKKTLATERKIDLLS